VVPGARGKKLREEDARALDVLCLRGQGSENDLGQENHGKKLVPGGVLRMDMRISGIKESGGKKRKTKTEAGSRANHRCGVRRKIGKIIAI